MFDCRMNLNLQKKKLKNLKPTMNAQSNLFSINQLLIILYLIVIVYSQQCG
jgi:hypothetical protein